MYPSGFCWQWAVSISHATHTPQSSKEEYIMRFHKHGFLSVSGCNMWACGCCFFLFASREWKTLNSENEKLQTMCGFICLDSGFHSYYLACLLNCYCGIDPMVIFFVLQWYNNRGTTYCSHTSSGCEWHKEEMYMIQNSLWVVSDLLSYSYNKRKQKG